VQAASASAPHLLDASDFKRELEEALPKANQTVTVVSAYLTLSGARWLAELLPESCVTTIVVRWKLGDLVGGASDLEVYEIARQKRWAFCIHQDLHAKVWLVDEVALFVGSSNATSRGLALVENGNWEFGVRVIPSAADLTVLSRRVQESVTVTNSLYIEIANVVQNIRRTGGPKDTAEWPKELADLVRPGRASTVLWVAECLQTDGSWLKHPGAADLNDPAKQADLSVLGLRALPRSDSAERTLSSALKSTAAYRWLVAFLGKSPEGEAYFGELTAALHDVLADDPKPYRQTVKLLLSNLLSWIAAFGSGEIEIDTPRHSQRVRLIKPLAE
jgi:hypothetical protein